MPASPYLGGVPLRGSTQPGPLICKARLRLGRLLQIVVQRVPQFDDPLGQAAQALDLGRPKSRITSMRPTLSSRVSKTGLDVPTASKASRIECIPATRRDSSSRSSCDSHGSSIVPPAEKDLDSVDASWGHARNTVGPLQECALLRGSSSVREALVS